MPRDVEVTIRPKAGGPPDRARVAYAAAFLPMAAAGTARVLAGSQTATKGLLILGALASLLGLSFAIRADFFAQTSLALMEQTIRRTGYLGRSAECARGAVTRIVEATVVVARLGGIPTRWLLFLDASGRTLMRAYAEYYPQEELGRFRAASAIPWDHLSGVPTVADVRRRLPGSFPWVLAHPWITTLLLVLIALVLASIGVAVAGAFH